MRIQAYIYSWTPIFAIVVDGNREVLQVVGWIGGNGPVPATGLYVGPTGYVSVIGDAVNIKGSSGDAIGLTDKLVDNEVPAGVVNGTNKVFTTANAFINNTTKVYMNGLRQKLNSSYTETSSNTVTFDEAPVLDIDGNCEIIIDYIKS